MAPFTPEDEEAAEVLTRETKGMLKEDPDERVTTTSTPPSLLPALLSQTRREEEEEERSAAEEGRGGTIGLAPLLGMENIAKFLAGSKDDLDSGGGPGGQKRRLSESGEDEAHAASEALRRLIGAQMLLRGVAAQGDDEDARGGKHNWLLPPPLTPIATSTTAAPVASSTPVLEVGNGLDLRIPSGGGGGTNDTSSSSTSRSSSPLSSSTRKQPYKSPFILYELSDDPKRKEFLDELFAYMQKRGTPINRLPIMAKQVLDLYELYNLVVARGGLVDVINKKLWQEIIKGLRLPSSITSAAFTLRTQYMKYLYPYECEKMKFSNPAELQSAIDGNRREGRRSSYGTYGDMVQPPLLPLQNLQNLQNLPNLQGLQNPLSLVTRPQLNGNGTTHPLAPQDYLLERVLTSDGYRGDYPIHMGRGGSPPGSQEALLEATRLTMWKLYNQGIGGGGGSGGGQNQEEPDVLKIPHPPHLAPPFPPQKEALNLEVKEDRGVPPLRAMTVPMPLQRPVRHKEVQDLRGRLEEMNQQPAAKRPAPHEHDPLDQRLPPPAATPTPGPGNVHGANIKITSRGDGRSQDQSLVVSMEINGILYQGVLFAQAPRARFS
ncbi:uncharacterized protein LOC143020683 isoform X7 [Oratosquilla oratoria]|uniref:uncharacterized protein LOC143020683 isoform X7 n=1 Tax=Oratosquilla oratoria TaxID=337810 RepID=UPI003F75EED4